MAEATLTIGPLAPVRALWPAEREATGTRAITCLRRGGISAVAELTASTAQDITDIPRAGAIVLAEVRAVLAEHGLSLRDDDGVTPAELEARVRRLMRAGLKRAVALRFARDCWPKGEVAPGITLEVAE